MRVILQADQWTKQNHKDAILPAHPQEIYLGRHGQLLREEDGAIEFWRIKKIIFGTNLRILSIGLMMCGRARWQEAEATRKDFNIVLIHQHK